MQISHDKDFINLCFLALALAFSLGAAVFDLKTRKIPNKYNLSFFCVAFVCKLILLTVSHQYIVNGLLGSLLGFVVFLPFFALRFAGGGDVKLLAALGMILGWKHFIWVFIFTSLIDGAFLIPLSFAKTVFLFLQIPEPLPQKITNFSSHLKGIKRSSKKPYALPVFLGCFAYLIIYVFLSQHLGCPNETVFCPKYYF